MTPHHEHMPPHELILERLEKIEEILRRLDSKI